jgi:2-polyprenyl-6-methoxyphenol hydroxylase-like FAD-dependent oxidoreductase
VETAKEGTYLRRGDDRRRNSRCRDIKIEYAKRLVSYEIAGHGGIIARRFEDGTEAQGDLLVRAGGIHSHVRRVMDPDVPHPSYTGLLSLGGYARGPRIPSAIETQHFVFGKRAYFGYNEIFSIVSRDEREDAALLLDV